MQAIMRNFIILVVLEMQKTSSQQSFLYSEWHLPSHLQFPSLALQGSPDPDEGGQHLVE